MKVITLFLILCLTFNSFAATGSNLKLENLFDDYRYSVDVEWDQKDQEFLKTITEKFQQDLNQLIKQEGLAQEELTSLLESKIPSKELSQALKMKLRLLGSHPSAEQIISVVNEHSKSLYKSGASWNGWASEGLLAISLLIVIVGAITLSINSSMKAAEECGGEVEVTECSTVNGSVVCVTDNVCKSSL